MNELLLALNNIADTYDDFISAIMHYAKKKPAREKAVLEYIASNPSASSSDIVRFVSNQPDFFEDAAPSSMEAL